MVFPISSAPNISKILFRTALKKINILRYALLTLFRSIASADNQKYPILTFFKCFYSRRCHLYQEVYITEIHENKVLDFKNSLKVTNFAQLQIFFNTLKTLLPSLAFMLQKQICSRDHSNAMV